MILTKFTVIKLKLLGNFKILILVKNLKDKITLKT